MINLKLHLSVDFWFVFKTWVIYDVNYCQLCYSKCEWKLASLFKTNSTSKDFNWYNYKINKTLYVLILLLFRFTNGDHTDKEMFNQHLSPERIFVMAE